MAYMPLLLSFLLPFSLFTSTTYTHNSTYMLPSVIYQSFPCLLLCIIVDRATPPFLFSINCSRIILVFCHDKRANSQTWKEDKQLCSCFALALLFGATLASTRSRLGTNSRAFGCPCCPCHLCCLCCLPTLGGPLSGYPQLLGL